MGWRTNTARAATLGAALLLFGAGDARAKDPSEILQQDLIVTRVERGAFPNVRLWIMPVAAESMTVDDGETPTVYEVVPDFLRAKNGAITQLQHPRNVRNIAAYYLEAGDKVFCARALYQPKSRRWVLDSIQRITERRAPKPVRGSRKLSQDPIEVTLTTDRKAYRVGEPIRFTLRATNRSNKPVELLFPSGETHNLSVYSGFEEIWRLATILQTSDAKKMPLKPGQSVEFSEVWDQKSTDGKAIPAGRFFVAGKIINEGRAFMPDTRIPLRIKPDEGQQASVESPAPSN